MDKNNTFKGLPMTPERKALERTAWEKRWRPILEPLGSQKVFPNDYCFWIDPTQFGCMVFAQIACADFKRTLVRVPELSSDNINCPHCGKMRLELKLAFHTNCQMYELKPVKNSYNNLIYADLGYIIGDNVNKLVRLL